MSHSVVTTVVVVVVWCRGGLLVAAVLDVVHGLPRYQAYQNQNRCSWKPLKKNSLYQERSFDNDETRVLLLMVLMFVAGSSPTYGMLLATTLRSPRRNDFGREARPPAGAHIPCLITRDPVAR